MMHHTEATERLQRAYAQLMRERANTRTGDEIPLEVIQALAEGTYAADDRGSMLERVLADPATAHEFHALRQVVSLRPPARARRVVPSVMFAAAAALVIAIGTTLTSRSAEPDETEPMRTGSTEVAIVAPASDARWSDQPRFVWSQIPGAASYRLDVVDADGAIAASQVTSDTSAALTMPAVRSTEYRWWVVATLRDQTTRRSAPRRLRP